MIHRPTLVEINLAALRHNLSQVRSHTSTEILAVVKADAYGHGAIPVARTLESEGVGFFGVAMLEEGVELRRAGVQTPILVLGGAYPGQEELFWEYRLIPTLFSLSGIERMGIEAQRQNEVLPFHLKIDTGMQRLGFSCAELPSVVSALSRYPFLRLDGVFTHLALADDERSSVTAEQAGRFVTAISILRDSGLTVRYAHLSNSAALFLHSVAECNLVRPGIALYGGLPAAELEKTVNLRPVMRFLTRIASLKEIPAGCGVSYGHRFRTRRTTRLAAIPVGYGDGLSRSLSGRGDVLVRGTRVPIAGTICMDWTMLDVTDLPEVREGDLVTLLGRDQGEVISAEEWAQKLGTISYEVFCQIGKRVPRVCVG